MRSRLWIPLALAVALPGCASLSPDGGVGAVQADLRAHLPQDVGVPRDAARARVAALLARPLTADDAVQIALLDNPGLLGGFDALIEAETRVVAARRLPNPGISIARLTRGDEVEWERSLHLDLARLLAMPLRADVESRLYERARRALVLDVLRLAADTRRAWVEAVAAAQAAGYRRDVLAVAEAGADLARRMAETGNWSVLRQTREQRAYADAALAAARAEQLSKRARERLVRLLGLDDDANLRLPERLPDLPDALPPLPTVEQQAMDTRIDLQVARLQAEALAADLGLTRRTRFVNVLELGVIDNDSNLEPNQRGYEIRFELPLFDGGSARVAAAEARYRQALMQARGLAVEARSQVREAHALRQSQYAVARHLRDEVVPLAQRASDETLLRYNGMLVDVFALLADARERVAAVSAALDAQRDYWLAEADLAEARVGRPAERPIGLAPPAASARADGH